MLRAPLFYLLQFPFLAGCASIFSPASGQDPGKCYSCNHHQQCKTAAARLQVWRIAFFSRLEERKGIKLFVEALSKLQATTKISDNPEFEIYIVGPEAVIDMVRTWLVP